MKCIKCNNQLKDGETICNVCGFKDNNSEQINVANDVINHHDNSVKVAGLENVNNNSNLQLNTNNNLEENQIHTISNNQNIKIENNNKKQKKKKKHRFLKFLLFNFFIFMIFKGINLYKQTLDKIYLTSNEIYGKKDNDNFYKIEDEIDEIKLKIKTFKKVKKTSIKLSTLNLILFEKDYSNNKKWTIEDFSLPMGSSDLEVEVTLDDGNIIKRRITLYNINESNLGELDVNDTDKDKLLNYQEIMCGTNRNKVDSDNDGLSDYDEIAFTMTDPTKYSTYENSKSDANFDYDLDKLTNLEEIKYGSNPVIVDTDGDGLSDYEEIIIYKTDFSKVDTDEDGVSDYDEVKNFNSNPFEITNSFSGRVQSENREVGITLNNITLDDINNNIVFNDTVVSILNENMVGYIMPAYDITTDVKFNSSELTFNFEGYELEEDAIPTIYYYNNENKSLEELPTKIDGKTASTTVTHFSTYILVDKNKFDDINDLDVDSKEAKINEEVDAQFVFFFSPILSSLFNNPLYIIASPDLSEAQGSVLKQKIVDSFDKSGFENVNLIISNNRIVFNAVKNFFNLVDKFLYSLLSNTLGSGFISSAPGMTGESYTHNMSNCLFIGYIERVEELGIVFLGSDEENIFEDSYVYIDLEDDKDTNKDGISDAFTKAILSGSITTSTGINPFEGYTLSQIHKNADLDGDKLKNGEEIKIINVNGKYVIDMISDPRLVDSDDDGIEDKEDLTPLEAYDSYWKFVDSLQHELNLNKYEKVVDKYNSLFGTAEIIDMPDGNSYYKYLDDGVIKYSPVDLPSPADEIFSGLAQAGDIYGAGDAEKAWRRYYEASGKPYTEVDLVEPSIFLGSVNKQSIIGSGDTQIWLEKNINSLMSISKEHVMDGELKVISSRKALNGTTPLSLFLGINAFGFLNNSSSYMIAEISNKNGFYTAKLRYFIVDVYDWDSPEECDLESDGGACVTEVSHFNDMLIGKAKAFLVKLEYDFNVSWSEKIGEIELLEGTPFA